MKCSSCGKSMKKQGGQFTCINESCPEYLVQKKPSKGLKSPIAQALAKGG